MQDMKPTTQLHMELTALEQLADVIASLDQQLQQRHVSEEKRVDLKLCVMEAVQNALLHGGTEHTMPKAQIVWHCSDESFCFTVTDNGSGVSPEVRDSVYQETLKENGRGLLLLRTILDEVYFNEQGNAITGVLHW